MFKKLTLCLICISQSIFVYAGYFPPKEIQKQIEQVEKLNDKCRGGSGDDPATIKACDKRDQFVKNVEKKGYCYGALNKDASVSQYQWLPCKIDATRSK
ncbi:MULTISPECIES: hypothetical protein [unclassified Acinetobacter]|uniref:hypothetical protein n=1 Tax=unclassified Acinetobacter TaxID=196816 RepID=UPI00124BDB3D|nr:MULTISPECIES: hypothetical protein [unclassified Acinetobacter]